MNSKIKELGELITGYTFRSAIESNINGNTFVLQAKNVVGGENLTSISSFSKIYLQTQRSTSFLQFDDVIVVSRGMGAGGFRSSVYKCKNNNVIASSSVYIIRLKDSRILPEYLSLYLNSRYGQSSLSQIATGVHLQTLLRSNLEDIEIPVPSIDKQKTIVSLYENINEQEKILNRKSEIRENMMSATFRNLVTTY